MAFNRNELGEANFTEADIFSAFSRKPSFTDQVFEKAASKVSLASAKLGLEVSIGRVRVSLGGLRASLGQVKTGLNNRVDSVSVYADTLNATKASKVSLYTAKTALEQLIDLRATQVSLANVKSELGASIAGVKVSLGGLRASLGQVDANLNSRVDSVSVYADTLSSTKASKVSLGSAKSALQSLIDLRATQVSLGNVQSQITALVGDAPEALDTIHELAGNVSLYATKVSLASQSSSNLSLFATKASLGSTKTALESLIDLRASQVSLANTQVSIGSLKSRVDILEAGGTQHDGTPAETVDINWTNLSEINVSGEKLLNGDFSANSYVQDTSFCLLSTCGLQPNNGHSVNHTFAEADRPKIIALQASSSPTLTEGTIYQIKNVNTGNEAIQIENLDGTSVGWTGGGLRGSVWEVVSLSFDNWTVTSGTLDETKLASGIVKGDGGQVLIQQTLSQNIAQGTDLVIKVTSDDDITFYPILSNGVVDNANSFDVLASEGYAEHTTQSVVSGFRISTVNGTREYSSVSVFQGAISGGTVEATTNTLTKIGGANGWNAGASSSQSIPSGHDGYFQFQIGGAGSLRVGLTYQDVDFSEPDPSAYRLEIMGDGTVFTDGYNSGAGFVSTGDRIRLRHYSSENEIRFQRKEDIYQADASIQPSTHVASQSDIGTKIVFLKTIGMGAAGGVYFQVTLNRGYEVTNWSTTNNQFMIVDDGGLNMWLSLNNSSSSRNRGDAWEFGAFAGQDYTTFHTSSQLTINQPLFLDASLYHTGTSQINDMIAFIGTPSASTLTTNITQENSADILQLQADLAAALVRIQALESSSGGGGSSGGGTVIPQGGYTITGKGTRPDGNIFDGDINSIIASSGAGVALEIEFTNPIPVSTLRLYLSGGGYDYGVVNIYNGSTLVGTKAAQSSMPSDWYTIALSDTAFTKIEINRSANGYGSGIAEIEVDGQTLTLAQTFTASILDTEANILARTGDSTGTVAYATDNQRIYVFNGSNWIYFNND